MQPTNSHIWERTFHSEPGHIEGQLKKTLRFQIQFLHAKSYNILLHSWTMLKYGESVFAILFAGEISPSYLLKANKIDVGGHLVSSFWRCRIIIFGWSMGWLFFQLDHYWTKPCKFISIHIPRPFQNLSIWMFASIADWCDPHAFASRDYQNKLSISLHKSLPNNRIFS